VQRANVLVLARDPVVAALLGMLLELESCEPVFARPGERPEDAISRLRPPLVILLDADMEVARSDLFFARATKGHATVVLFGRGGANPDVAAAPGARGILWLAMPTDRATLARVLEAALAVTS
jgi:DNA-binding NtrC family response regulator